MSDILYKFSHAAFICGEKMCFHLEKFIYIFELFKLSHSDVEYTTVGTFSISDVFLLVV